MTPGNREILDFAEQVLREKLLVFTMRERSVFSLACAKRCYPCYELWTESVGQEPDARIPRLIHQLERAITEMSYNARLVDFEDFDEMIIDLIPTEESDWSPQMPLAEHALSSLAYVVRSVVSGDVRESAWAARRAFEAADQAAINAICGTGSNLPPDHEILVHFFVQQELSRQKRDLVALELGDTSKVLEHGRFECILDASPLPY